MREYFHKLIVGFIFGGKWQNYTHPISEIADYAGEKYAFYIAWLIHYTSWLLLPSAFGIIILAIQLN